MYKQTTNPLQKFLSFYLGIFPFNSHIGICNENEESFYNRSINAFRQQIAIILDEPVPRNGEVTGAETMHSITFITFPECRSASQFISSYRNPYPTIHSRGHHFSQIASLYTPQKASPPMAIIANIRSHNFALSDISHWTTIPFQLTGLMNLTCSGLKVLTLSQESSHLLQMLWL